MRLFGGILPFLGWKEYGLDTVEMLEDQGAELAPGVPVTTSRRYSGFQFEWGPVLLGYGLKDLGPREYERTV